MTTEPPARIAARKWRVKDIVIVVLLAAILIAGSGRIDWAYIAVVAAGPLATHRLLAKISPDLLAERAKLQAATKPWDSVRPG